MKKRSFLSHYIDRMAVLTDDRRVFGVKTVRIKNGCQFDKEPKGPLLDGNRVDIAVTAMFAFWHGYERLLGGLNAYLKNGGRTDYRIHFTGDGPEVEQYRKLSRDYGIEEHVVFYGRKDSVFLEELYRRCHFGCCSLGAYKKGLYFSCELKSREYLAAGLPIITGCRLDIDGTAGFEPYILSFPNDASLIDFGRIDGMYRRLYVEQDETQVAEMRRQIYLTARAALDMEAAMGEVVRYISENSGE